MIKWILALLAAQLWFWGDAHPASAQANCHAAAVMRAGLAEKYGETRQSVGLANGKLVEVYANPETGTFSILVTDPLGQSCMVSAGHNFETVNEAALPEGGRL